MFFNTSGDRRAWNMVPRRQALQSVSGGLLAAALNSLCGRSPVNAEQPGSLSQVHKPQKANAIIHLFMNGGPSQMDLFDPKVELDRLHGKSFYKKIAGEIENPQSAGALMRSPFKFRRHGESGTWVSELMPCLAGCVDDIALIRSMFTSNLTHEPALFKIHGGRELPGLPSLGSWVTYGLGSENQNLPAYIVLDDPAGLPINGIQNWQSGFLPPSFQGTRFRSEGPPVLNLKPGFSQPQSVELLERSLLRQLDDRHLRRYPNQPELDARIASYELAARMQMAATDALDLSQESAATQAMYGLDQAETRSYGRRCLIARRMVERGVRFVQLFINAQIWDHHTNIADGLTSCCRKTDRPIAALITDLKQRGLLDTTLLVWGGEFGRLPIAQLPGDKDERKAGRDHNKNAMVTWMAGGGVNGGVTHGETDEIGLAAVEDRVSVADFHATMLHLAGLDHRRLTLNRNGLDERLTGVENARIVHEILA